MALKNFIPRAQDYIEHKVDLRNRKDVSLTGLIILLGIWLSPLLILGGLAYLIYRAVRFAQNLMYR